MTPADFPQQKQAQCWCGGVPTASTHPLYGSCTTCGTQVLLRQLSAEELKTFYSEGYWHEFVQNTYNLPAIEERAVNDFYDRLPHYFRMLLRYSPLPGSLLEIGCSHGGFLYYCLKNGVAIADGIEVDANICAFAKKRFGLPSVIPGFFPDVALPRPQYDVVVGFDVLEHFINPIEVMSSVADKIGETGICFFLTPCYRGEDQTWDRFRPDEHTFLYTDASVRELFNRSGLEVIDLIPGLYSQDMFIIGRKKGSGAGIQATQEISSVAIKESIAVSVIITTRNQTSLLKDALDSCKLQTFRPQEVIVVNTGAIDIGPVVEQYRQDLPLTHISKPAGAAVAAGRNAGITTARGDFCVFLNDGETFYPNHLETLVSAIDPASAMAVYGDSYRALQVVKGSSYFTFRRDLVFAADFDKKRLAYENLFPLHCAIIRTSCFSGIGLFDETLDWCSDWDFWIRFAEKHSARHIQRITSEYVFRADGSLLSAAQREAFIRAQNLVLRRYTPSFDPGSPFLQDPRRNRAPCERDAAIPYPRIDAFMTAVVRLVEQNEIPKALQYYSAARPIMPPSPELEQFDKVMERIYKK
jgi:glycosyltransferase involved in cell wall biosynthesis/SAM-dependent methyltransferase